MQARMLTLLPAALLLVAAGCAMLERPEPAPVQSAIDLYVRGQLLAEGGDVEAALAELAAAVEADPTLSVAYSAAGDIHRKRGNWHAAAQSYEKACQANPFAFRPHYHLGLAYQTLAQAAELAEQAHHYLLRAVEAYLQADMLDPADADTDVNLAACYFELGDVALAEQYAREAVANSPEDAAARSNLGVIYETQDRLYEAIRAYKESLEIDPHQSDVLISLGSAYMRQNRLKLAVSAFEIATEEDPLAIAPWEQIGSCQYRMGQYIDAEEAYLRALELHESGGSAAAYRGLGVVYMTRYVLDQEQADLRDKALIAWHASLEIKPDQPDLERLVKKYTPAYDAPQL